MNLKLLYRTIRHLKPTQILFQVFSRLHKAKYVQLPAPEHDICVLTTDPIPRYNSMNGDEFTFINLSHRFTDWNFVGNGTLFTYNQNYFDFINAAGVSAEEACRWIDRFIDDRSTITWGMDPYPIALRIINWMKFFCKHPDCATKVREDFLWSQLCLLEKKLEYHLLGNHLLEDFYALYIGGCYFKDKPLVERSHKRLLEQLHEQTLADGAHFEQSPMYHSILLDRLLDCINFGTTDDLKAFAEKQLGWLESICFSDGSWPMFNDSSLGIAPTTSEIFDYARRLGLSWNKSALGESGYRKLAAGRFEAIVDVGNITASYQPGHTHADALNYELRIDGKPFMVDTGISTYDKTVRRQYERCTAAHNTVEINGKNSSEVWGGFRVGYRHKCSILEESDQSITAVMRGFGDNSLHARKFEINENAFCIEDRIDENKCGISFIHLAEGVDADRVRVEGADKVEVLDSKYSVEYNRFIENKTIAIRFTGMVRYEIS